MNVANGSPLDSPAQGSNVGLQFNGVDTFLTSQGFRGTFISDAGVANNEPADSVDEPPTGPDGGFINVSTSFTVLSQAWIRPEPAGQGTAQTVWSVGTELGGVRITPEGFWELVNTTPPGQPGPGILTTSRAVQFGQWTHVAALRTGGSASIYINGAVAASGNGFFGAWPGEIILGADITTAEPFRGVVDNFSTVGTAGFGIVISTDLDYFSDLGLPTPTGVPGDVDQDGDADQADYNLWSANAGFNNTFGQGDLSTLVKGDLDQNGKIDFFDFRIIARGATATGVALKTAVPEPAAGATLAIGLVAACLARRRGGVR